MKKISIFMLGAMALTFAACEDGPSVPPVQSNPQGPVYEASHLSSEVVGPFAQGNLNLNDYTSAEAEIPMLKIVDTDSLPENAILSFDLEIASKENFSDAKTVPMTVVGDEALVDAATLNATHVAVFGKSPKEKTVYYRVPAYMEVNGITYRFGGMDYYVAQGTYGEICIDAGFKIESSYYIIGNMNDWSFGSLIQFDHSSADVYDDPVFSMVLTVADDCYWKIVPESAVADQNWDILYGTEVDGDDSFEGKLVEKGNAGKIAAAGKYRFTINMETLAYTIQPVLRPEYLCTPGGYNSWSQTASSWINYSEGKEYYCGAVMEKDGFKITDGDSWDNDKTWGLGDEGMLTQPGSDIPVAAEGLYWLVVDLNALTYVNTEVTSVGIVGVNSWDQNEPLELTPNADKSVWSADLDLSGEWKIVINHSWDSNYGGSIDNLVFDAGNMTAPADGKYTVTVDFTGNYPTMSLK